MLLLFGVTSGYYQYSLHNYDITTQETHSYNMSVKNKTKLYCDKSSVIIGNVIFGKVKKRFSAYIQDPVPLTFDNAL